MPADVGAAHGHRHWSGRPAAICLVTSGEGRARAMLGLIEAAVDAGVDLIQVRERGLDDRTLLDVSRNAAETARGSRSCVLVNGRPDIALASGACGVHLRSDSPPAERVRSMTPDGFLIGRSVHGADEAAAVARSRGCDYLTFGTVFPSASKPPGHPAAGLDALRRTCASVGLPVLAIGGVTVGRAAAVAAAGAAGIAAIGLFASPSELSDTVRQLREALTRDSDNV